MRDGGRQDYEAASGDSHQPRKHRLNPSLAFQPRQGKRKDYLAPRKSNQLPETLGSVDRKAAACSNVHRLKIHKWNIFSSPLLNPLKPGMLVKNSLAVAWILQNPTAGKKIKEPLETALSGYPLGSGLQRARRGGFQEFADTLLHCLGF